GHAVDGGDDRLGHVAHAENGRMVKGAKQLAGTHLAVRGPGGIKVGARAEPTTRAGDQDGANGLVAAGTLDRGAEGGDQLRRDRVEHIGAVEGDAGDAVGRLVKDGFAHDWSPFWFVVLASTDSAASSLTTTWSGATCCPGRAQTSSTLARKGASVR